MTELLEEALSRLRERPAADQDLAAEVIFAVLDRDYPRYTLTPEQVEEVRRVRRELRSGEMRVLTDQEAEEMWRRLGA